MSKAWAKMLELLLRPYDVAPLCPDMSWRQRLSSFVISVVLCRRPSIARFIWLLLRGGFRGKELACDAKRIHHLDPPNSNHMQDCQAQTCCRTKKINLQQHAKKTFGWAHPSFPEAKSKNSCTRLGNCKEGIFIKASVFMKFGVFISLSLHRTFSCRWYSCCCISNQRLSKLDRWKFFCGFNPCSFAFFYRNKNVPTPGLEYCNSSKNIHLVIARYSDWGGGEVFLKELSTPTLLKEPRWETPVNQ